MPITPTGAGGNLVSVNLPSEKAALMGKVTRVSEEQQWKRTQGMPQTLPLHSAAREHSMPSYSLPPHFVPQERVHHAVWPSRTFFGLSKEGARLYRRRMETKSGQTWDGRAIDSCIWQMSKCQALRSVLQRTW